MNPIHADNDTLHTASRGDRAKLLVLGGLMLLAGMALAVAAGPPRLPPALPRSDDVLSLLAGATLPLDAILLVLVDAAWAVWTWIVLSLLLECALSLAELATHGGSRWIRSSRRFADRASVPLVRRAVAAAFAVQVISRGVPIASAQSLPPVDATIVAVTRMERDSTGAVPDAPETTPTYLVHPGDTLWSIAERAYGSGTDYRRLVDANVGRRMSDGQVFSARGVICPGWQLAVPGAVWQVQVVDGQRWYTVRPGDTLSSISAATLGDPQRWPELFDLNRGATAGGSQRALLDANTIWPGLRLRLPDQSGEAAQVPDETAPSEPRAPELQTASAVPGIADRHFDDLPDTSPPRPGTANPPASEVDVENATSPPTAPPLLRTQHSLQPVVLDPADSSSETEHAESTPALPEAAGGGVAGDTQISLPTPPWRSDVPGLPLALGGLGLAGAAGVALGARRIRRLRPLAPEPESEVVVEGGFAEAQPAHDLTRGLHGIGFDPVTSLVSQLEQFLSESGFADSPAVSVLAVRHGRSSTTITIRCGLAEQGPLLEAAPAFARALDAEVDACVSGDQDVLWQLVRVRKTRLLPSGQAAVDPPCLLPVGVLYDRQMYSVAWNSLGHILVASLPGHGADTILTSLVATLVARRSPERLRLWMLASARALPASLFELPHLVRVVDPVDDAALQLAVEDLRRELDGRTAEATNADLLVVVPELATLGEHAARFALLAERALSLGVRFIVGSSDPEQAIGDPLTPHLSTRMVLHMQTEEASVALLGVADAAFVAGGGRLLLRVDGREPVELYGYQVTNDHLERLVKVMRLAYPTRDEGVRRRRPKDEPPDSAASIGPLDLEPATPTRPVAEPDVADPSDAPAPEARHTEPAPDDPPPPNAHASTNAASIEPAIDSNVPQIPIEIQCFGSPRVLCAGQLVWPRSGGDAKPWELLLFLAVQPADGASKDEVTTLLWPGDEVEDLAHRVRQLRFRLRRQLQQVPGGPQADGICLDRRTLRLDPGLVCSDAHQFLDLVQRAKTKQGADAIHHLEQARTLYVGDLLTGPDVRRYAWLDERDGSGVTLREHFRYLFQSASSRLAELYAEAGDSDLAVMLYRELTEIDPADERLWQALFRLHAQRNDRDALVAEGRRLHQTLRDLADELDTPYADEPGNEVTQEYERLLARLTEREPATA